MSYHSSRHRGAGTEAVDCRSLASYVLRRCEGCSIEEHRASAERFFAAQPGKFNDTTREQVIRIILENARTEKPDVTYPDAEVVNGSVVCSTCGRRYYDHDLDKEYPWFTRVCGDKLVRVT